MNPEEFVEPRGQNVSIPLALFNAMASCYWGAGPRYGEPPPEINLTMDQRPQERPDGELPSEGEVFGRVQEPLGRLKPAGYAKRKAEAMEARHEEVAGSTEGRAGTSSPPGSAL